MKKRFLIAVLFVLVFAGYSFKVYDVNANAIKVEKYDYEEKKDVPLENDFFYNSTEDMNGYSVCVNATEIIDADELKRRYKVDEEDIITEHVVLVNMSFTNYSNNNQSSGINLSEYLLQNSSYIRSVDRNLFFQINDFNSLLFTLPVETSVDFVLPFSIFPEYVDINTLKNGDSHILISFFPHKKEIKLDIS